MTSAALPLSAFATDSFPDTPYSYGESELWLKHAVDASYWEESGDHFMAARVGMASVALAPTEQLPRPSVDLRMALSSLATDPGDPRPELVTFLTDVVDWALASGWLDQHWTTIWQPPSTQAEVAWSVFPGAIVALVQQAGSVGRREVVARYMPIALQRLRPMVAVLPAWIEMWVKRASEAGWS